MSQFQFLNNNIRRTQSVGTKTVYRNKKSHKKDKITNGGVIPMKVSRRITREMRRDGGMRRRLDERDKEFGRRVK